MSFPGMKALYSSDTNSPRIELRRLTKHFEMVLYTTLHKLIGLNSVIIFGLSTLGMRTIVVEFTPSDIIPVAKNSLTVVMISSLGMLQWR